MGGDGVRRRARPEGPRGCDAGQAVPPHPLAHTEVGPSPHSRAGCLRGLPHRVGVASPPASRA